MVGEAQAQPLPYQMIIHEKCRFVFLANRDVLTAPQQCRNCNIAYIDRKPLWNVFHTQGDGARDSLYMYRWLCYMTGPNTEYITNGSRQIFRLLYNVVCTGYVPRCYKASTLLKWQVISYYNLIKASYRIQCSITEFWRSISPIVSVKRALSCANTLCQYNCARRSLDIGIPPCYRDRGSYRQ